MPMFCLFDQMKVMPKGIFLITPINIREATTYSRTCFHDLTFLAVDKPLDKLSYGTISHTMYFAYLNRFFFKSFSESSILPRVLGIGIFSFTFSIDWLYASMEGMAGTPFFIPLTNCAKAPVNLK